jgi:hypothetical protein
MEMDLDNEEEDEHNEDEDDQEQAQGNILLRVTMVNFFGLSNYMNYIQQTFRIEHYLGNQGSHF